MQEGHSEARIHGIKALLDKVSKVLKPRALKVMLNSLFDFLFNSQDL